MAHMGRMLLLALLEGASIILMTSHNHPGNGVHKSGSFEL